MNFLSLCQRLRQEAGLSGSGPSTVVDQTGESKMLVDWINTAYIDILNQQSTWRFMQKTFSFNTTADKRKYSISEIGLTDFERWKVNLFGDFRIYLTSAGENNEQYLQWLNWEDYRQVYLFGATRSATGLPNYFTYHPDNSLDFYLVPNDIYTVTGEYYASPTELSLNTDEPIFPTQFHMAIVWRALMLYAAFDAANEKYAHGRSEYMKLLRRLEFDQLPVITFGNPLA